MRPIFLCSDPGTAVPVPAVRLIVHFGNVLSGSRHYSSGVEHHARDWVVVRICIMYSTGSEIPDLVMSVLERRKRVR